MLDMAELVEPVTADTIGDVIYDRFRVEPDLLNIAVIDDQHRPIGLIERNAFSLKLAGQYGRGLYAGRPIELLMNTEPMVVDGAVKVQAFTADALLARPSDLMRGFIVTHEGRYVGVGSALSVLQAQNVSIRHHAAEAQAALRAKAEFLAVMSHEIRTPLNGVLALAGLAARQLRQDELRPHMDTIIRSGETLLRLLNDALDLSRAEAGRLELEEEPLRIADLVDDIDALWRPRAMEAGLRLTTSLDGDRSVWALGDAVRLKQILNNLVGNALKFTAAGSVDVRATVDVQDLYVTLAAEVRDTGPGMAADDLKRLFKPFSQTDDGRRAGGAGLGLSICRQLAEKMDGTVEAESKLGIGSVFRFKVVLFKCQPPLAIDGPAEVTISEDAPHVLIADDNATNRMVAETLCRSFDCTCESVADGAAAVELARTGRFDIILMDIKMPVMDGLEAVRQIRTLAAPLSRVPIIALTANADPFDAQAYLAQGMDAVVEKPIRAETLVNVMNRLLTEVAEQEAA
jgi:signal transduction histidine kinase/ActR/RegA family two-component response regulator